MEWQKDSKGQWCCPYNQGVHCVDRQCWKCGFSPTTAKIRRLTEENKRLREQVAYLTAKLPFGGD